jgi:hypothetical protein
MLFPFNLRFLLIRSVDTRGHMVYIREQTELSETSGDHDVLATRHYTNPYGHRSQDFG